MKEAVRDDVTRTAECPVLLQLPEPIGALQTLGDGTRGHTAGAVAAVSLSAVPNASLALGLKRYRFERVMPAASDRSWTLAANAHL
jgi:hypothetical protein